MRGAVMLAFGIEIKIARNETRSVGSHVSLVMYQRDFVFESQLYFMELKSSQQTNRAKLSISIHFKYATVCHYCRGERDDRLNHC